MITILRDTKIKAPFNKAFDFLSEPKNLTEIWSNLVEIKNIKRPKVGNNVQYDWVYKMAGMRLDGKSEITDFVLYERLVTKSRKGSTNTTTWNFNKVEHDTELQLKIEYEIPASLHGKVDEKTIVEENEHEVDAMLENLRRHIELELAHA